MEECLELRGWPAGQAAPVASGLVHLRVRLTVNLALADLRMEAPTCCAWAADGLVIC